MKISLIISTQDEASKNIYEHLKETFPENEIVTYAEHEVTAKVYDKEPIYLERIDEELDADLLLFATKHQSKSGVNSLSIHTQGNWGPADFGGKEKDLAVCPAGWLKESLKILERLAREMHYEPIQECTHHGPEIHTPSMFIEIGSQLEEWQNEKAGRAIAQTILKLLKMKIPSYKTAVGIGGPHHTPSFAKVQLNTDIAVGHVCPKYNLDNLDEDMIRQAIKRTSPRAELVIIDWKGVGEHKERIKEMLSNIGVEWKKTKDYKR